MGFKLLSISSIYPGNINEFYKSRPEATDLSYEQHNELLLKETTEFCGAYNRMFRIMGVQADCIVINDEKLQKKWNPRHSGQLSGNMEIIFNQFKYFQPSVLWIENITVFTSQWIDRIRSEINSIRLIIAYHCSPYNNETLDLFRKVDLIITCTPGLKYDFEKHGFKTYLVYHGFDDRFLLDTGNKAESRNHNLIFSGSLSFGTGFHSDRLSLIESLLKADIDIELYVNRESKYKFLAKKSLYLLSKLTGRHNMKRMSRFLPVLEFGLAPTSYYSNELLHKMHPPVYGHEMYKLFGDSKIVLNFHIGAAGQFAGNMRMFEVTGAGSCLLTDNKKNMRELFEPESEVVTFDNADDCVHKAKWLLENDTEREKIALAGNKRTLRDHTVKSRCMQVIDIIEQELKHK